MAELVAIHIYVRSLSTMRSLTTAVYQQMLEGEKDATISGRPKEAGEIAREFV